MSFCIQTGNLVWDIVVNVLIFVAGTAVLVKGSDWFVDAAANLARRWGVPEIIIGLTLVSIGTSLPELASSTYAAFQGKGDFIIGNIIGSNVTNISLILAIGIIGMGKMPFDRKVLTRDGVFMLIVYLVCFALFALPVREGASTLHGIDLKGGIILLVLCVSYIFFLFRQGKIPDPEEKEDAPEEKKGSALLDLFLLALGIAMITAGAKGMVDPVVWGAEQLGVPMLIISSTIVAFGTSVPELAVTLAGIIKKRHEIALGNIIGSNIFNILLIFGVTGCITVLPLETGWIGLLNLGLMGATGLLLLFFLFIGKTCLTRGPGFLLLLIYLFFMICNGYAAFTA